MHSNTVAIADTIKMNRYETDAATSRGNLIGPLLTMPSYLGKVTLTLFRESR